jgi:endonuclease/exonuclease/phosphatase family metal-dependent hydrolase
LGQDGASGRGAGGLSNSVLSALVAKEQHYTLVEKDPAFAGALPDTSNHVIGVQDQEAILARTDEPRGFLNVSDPQFGVFAAHVSIPFPGLPAPLPVNRGWGSVDVQTRGDRFRFINTHLESNDATVNELQAKELLAGPANSNMPVVLVGDFNAEASGAGSPTYSDLIGGGLTDAWTQTQPTAPGYTWGRDNLANPTTPFTERIDLVLFHTHVRALTTALIGTDPADHTPSGLWASDHLAVDATLRL